MRRQACLPAVGIGLLAGGCNAGRELADRGDCVGRFENPQGVTHDGIQPRSQRPTTGRVLGRGALLGCEDEVVLEAKIVELGGVDGHVAVAFDPDPPDQPTIIWSRPGYILETPEHRCTITISIPQHCEGLRPPRSDQGCEDSRIALLLLDGALSDDNPTGLRTRCSEPSGCVSSVHPCPTDGGLA